MLLSANAYPSLVRHSRVPSCGVRALTHAARITPDYQGQFSGRRVTRAEETSSPDRAQQQQHVNPDRPQLRQLVKAQPIRASQVATEQAAVFFT
jgi:hypothetical protein